MPAKSNKDKKPPPPATNKWDAAIACFRIAANLLDKSIIAGIILLFGAIIFVLVCRWPENDLPVARKDLLQPLLYAPWIGLFLVALAFYLLRHFYASRIAELSARLRKYEGPGVSGRLSSTEMPLLQEPMETDTVSVNKEGQKT
jgi:hypothetical protein